jgi:hypothetical protein
VEHARQKHGITERRACWLARQPRGTQRYRPTQRADENKLTQAIGKRPVLAGCTWFSGAMMMFG